MVDKRYKGGLHETGDVLTTTNVGKFDGGQLLKRLAQARLIGLIDLGFDDDFHLRCCRIHFLAPIRWCLGFDFDRDTARLNAC